MNQKDKKMNQTVDEKILEQIVLSISDRLDVTPDEIRMDAHLANDLGLDSLDQIEMFLTIERNLKCSIPDSIKTVRELINAIKETSILDWIRNGQVQPAKETVAPKAAEPVQKPAIQKPSAKKTMVTLTNIPQGLGEQTKLNCGEITEKQKQDFLASVMRFDPESTNLANHCGFNLYYDKFNAWVTPFDMKRNYKPQYRRNGDKEMVIQTMPMKSPECGAYEKSECPKYLADGKCTSPLVKRTVGALLFPDKYGKER